MGKIYKSTVAKVLRPNESMAQLAEQFRIMEAREKRNLAETKSRAEMWAVLLKANSPVLDEWEEYLTLSIKKEWGPDCVIKFNRKEKIISVENRMRKLAEDVFCG